MTGTMDRRALLVSAPVALLSAAAMAAPEAARQMTREEQIAYHKAELWRLFAEDVPDRGRLSMVLMRFKEGGQGDVVRTAKMDGRTDEKYPFFVTNLESEWELHVSPSTRVPVEASA